MLGCLPACTSAVVACEAAQPARHDRKANFTTGKTRLMASVLRKEARHKRRAFQNTAESAACSRSVAKGIGSMHELGGFHEQRTLANGRFASLEAVWPVTAAQSL